jgi:hypothetical protein
MLGRRNFRPFQRSSGASDVDLLVASTFVIHDPEDREYLCERTRKSLLAYDHESLSHTVTYCHILYKKVQKTEPCGELPDMIFGESPRDWGSILFDRSSHSGFRDVRLSRDMIYVALENVYPSPGSRDSLPQVPWSSRRNSMLVYIFAHTHDATAN